jgi:hypothetical protein
MYTKIGPITLISDIKSNEWDGGGMSCSAPVGREIIIKIGHKLSFSIVWLYSQEKLARLRKEQPDLWDNC